MTNVIEFDNAKWETVGQSLVLSIKDTGEQKKVCFHHFQLEINGMYAELKVLNNQFDHSIIYRFSTQKPENVLALFNSLSQQIPYFNSVI